MIEDLKVAGLCLLLLCSCQKEINVVRNIEAETSPKFVQYTIQQGHQFCDQNLYKSVQYSELKFAVKFDSSAIYTTTDPSNQYDINKLFGFSDNKSGHQRFSARFGWRWSDKALRLFGYIYNNGIRERRELGPVNIGIENSCSIKVTPGSYIFTLNNVIDSMPRKSTTINAIGYQLYPYFGGDETTPHKITIAIKEL